MEPRNPFASLVGDAPVRTPEAPTKDERPISPTIQALIDRYDALRQDVDRLLEADKRARERELDAIVLFKGVEAEALREHEGLRSDQCKAQATIDTLAELKKLEAAKARRRLISEQLRVGEKEFDALAALAHAYNRECRVEMAGL